MAGEAFLGGSFSKQADACPAHTAAIPPWIGPRHRSRLRQPADVKPGEAVPDIWELEGFRFRNDDGSETTATWIAAQDTNANQVIDTPFRLRTLVNVTGDPGAKQFRLQYRKVGDTNWENITVG